MVKWLNGYGTTKIFLFLTILLAPLYVVRFNVGPYSSTLLEVLVGLTVAAWVLGKFKNRDFKLPASSFQLPITLFLLAAVVSVIVSPDKRGALGILKAYFVEPLLIYLVIKNVVKSKKDWWLVFSALALSGLWVALLAVFQGLTGWLTFAPHEAALGRAHAIYNTANAVGLYLGPIILLLLGVFGRFREFRGFGAFGIALMVAAIVLSKSAGAMVGLVVSLGVLGVVRALGTKWLNCYVAKLLGLTVLVAGIWFFFNISNFTPKNVDPYVRKSTDTLQFRLCLWEGARNLLLDRPVFGAGLSGFKELYSTAYFTCDVESLEYPHNWVLNFWAETGILGLLGFLGILGLYFERVKRVEKVKRGLGVAFAAAMLYWLVHGLVDVPYFKNDLSLEFFVIVGLAETLGFALPAGRQAS